MKYSSCRFIRQHRLKEEFDSAASLNEPICRFLDPPSLLTRPTTNLGGLNTRRRRYAAVIARFVNSASSFLLFFLSNTDSRRPISPFHGTENETCRSLSLTPPLYLRRRFPLKAKDWSWVTAAADEAIKASFHDQVRDFFSLCSRAVIDFNTEDLTHLSESS